MTELYNALAKAQAEMKAATLDAVNPAFKSRYATLASVIAAIQGPLTRHGIAFSQRVESDLDTVSVETILMGHGSELRCGAVRIPVGKPGAQAFGSALTYARRYSLSAACCITADDDDDGNGAQQASEAPAPRQAPPPPAVLTDRQIEELQIGLFNAGKDDESSVQKLLRSQGVARIEDILQARYPAIIKRLKELEKK